MKDLNYIERNLLRGALSKELLRLQESLKNTLKIADEAFRTKVVKALRSEIKIVEGLQVKISNFVS